MRVAVLGGTFDPVHNAHLLIAQAVRDHLGAELAWLLPAGRPNLRGEPIASLADRLAMLQAAAAGVDGVEVNEMELTPDATAHTADTWDRLVAERPDVEAWWILGADAARRLPDWHRSDHVRARARLAVVQRSGTPWFTPEEAAQLGLRPDRVLVLDLVPPEISATAVRRRVAAGLAIEDLVPPAVATLIGRRGLYGGPTAAVP